MTIGSTNSESFIPNHSSAGAGRAAVECYDDGMNPKGWREGEVVPLRDLLQKPAASAVTEKRIAPRDDSSGAAIERLLEETNILRLEGRLFCFDPREAQRRKGLLAFDDGSPERRVTIELHPSYGQPSVLAYRVLQAIFKKITDGGVPASGTVSFSQRELARLAGRQTFGGTQSKQLFHALMQLHRTGISAALVDRETKEWRRADFVLITKLLTSGRGTQVSACVVSLETKIIESLNKRHWACFNWERMRELEPIGMALYKRLFRHFSNLYQSARTPEALRFEKDYDAILAEWLGGLKPERYASRVAQQLGAHLDAVAATGLIRRWQIAKKADARGLKITFYPGKAFFGDYDQFYRSPLMPPVRTVRDRNFRAVQQPHELVAYFHERRGQAPTMFHAKEVAFASGLLDRYSYDDARDLIDYAIDEARKTHFEMRFLTAIKQYLPAWQRAA